MRSTISLACALVFALMGGAPALAAPKEKSAAEGGGKKSGKEISTDDKALDKQMDWENKVLGPATQKRIDIAKIQKLQAEELARREKQEKIDQVEKDRKEREAAAAAAAQRNTKAPSTREVPSIQETPPPSKPVEKHDDAFVDKVLTGKSEKKKVTVTNDEVDQLLNKAKQEKGASISPSKGKGKGGGDTVDQLLATSDKQASIKTTPRSNDAPEAVSAEAAAREATLKAIAAAAAKAQEEKARNRRPAVPDAAMLRAQAAAKAPPPRSESPKTTASRTAWTDPFASDSSSGSSTKNRGKVTAAVAPPPPARAAAVPPASARTPAAASGRHPPSTRPAGNEGWQDPFDTGSGAKSRPAPAKPAPSGRPGKRPPNWKDPFA